MNELIEYFLKRGLEEDKSSKEWEAQYPGCDQAHYRAGCANTFTEVVEKLRKVQSAPVTDQAKTT